MNSIHNRTTAAERPLSESDLAVLAAVKRFHYLTPAQLCRLLYPACHDENRYARRRLASLAQRKLLLRLNPLPAPRHGSAPYVYTLDRAGRELSALSDTYFRPSEERGKGRNLLFMVHTLATIDVLIAAEVLCRTHPVTFGRLLIERELRRAPGRVTLAGAGGKPPRSVAVIPDAWFELAVTGRKPAAIALELDRGTEDQRAWRAKVEALAAWAAGPYRETFAAQTLTIAVLTPDTARRDTLRHWTAQELARIGQQSLLEIFLFTAIDPVTASPAVLFFDDVWYEPERAAPVSLLLPPVEPQASVRPLSQEVWQSG